MTLSTNVSVVLYRLTQPEFHPSIFKSVRQHDVLEPIRLRVLLPPLQVGA